MTRAFLDAWRYVAHHIGGLPCFAQTNYRCVEDGTGCPSFGEVERGDGERVVGASLRTRSHGPLWCHGDQGEWKRLRRCSGHGQRPWRALPGPFGLFLLALDYGRRPAARKAAASASLRADGSQSVRSTRTLAPNTLRPDPALRWACTRQIIGARRQKEQASQREPHYLKGTDMSDTLVPGTENRDQGTIEHICPMTLVLETNVRDDAALDRQFLASIKENGVLIPIAAVRLPDGQVVVRAGQRRTLAAREVGLPTVPVYVREVTDVDDKAHIVQRVTEQIVENDQRLQLSAAQRARGIQQMIDAGASITGVARKLSVPKDTIKAATVAAKSQTAMQGLTDGQLSLEEAAALVEFEDLPGAVSRLMQAAGSRRFEHVVAQLRQEKITAEAEAKAAQAFIEQGFTWLQETPGSFDPDCVPLNRLRTAEDAPVDESAVTNPAHWAVLLYESDGLVDAQTGEVVDEDDVDWATQDDPDAVPAEGLRPASTVSEVTVFVPQYFCRDYHAAGLTVDSWFARNAGLVGSDAGTVDLDDDAREAERQRIAAEQAEAEKRERRKVLALNKLGAAALTVRRDFVKKLLARLVDCTSWVSIVVGPAV